MLQPLPTPHRTGAAAAALGLLASTFTLSPSACPAGDAHLRLGLQGNQFVFHLAGDAGGGPWLLQHSVDAADWSDLLFLDPGKDPGGTPALEVPRAALPAHDDRAGFFRAVMLERDDPFLRDFLAAAARWRASGMRSYSYEMTWSSSIFWHGTVTVIDGEVASSETILSLPPLDQPPVLETIDGLFDMIARARANDAEVIQVGWHPELGFPATCFVDISAMIADEEWNWTVSSVTPLPPEPGS